MFLAPLGIIVIFDVPVFVVAFVNDRLFCRHLDPSPPQMPHSSSWTGESIIWKKYIFVFDHVALRLFAISYKSCKWNVVNIDNRGQFHHCSTSSFYARRSRRYKKAAWYDFFALLGPTSVKAACRMLLTLTPGLLKYFVEQNGLKIVKFCLSPCHIRVVCTCPGRRCCWGCRRSR